ncbi:unnamed protein product, partial [Meganyctiphanes norvegica]
VHLARSFKNIEQVNSRMKIPILLLVILTVCFLQPSLLRSTDSGDRFFIIGHMKNTIKTVEKALAQGANSVETDLNFQENTGKPTVFKHGWPCDVSIFSPLNTCTASSSYSQLLRFLSKQTRLALIVLEGKVNSLSSKVKKLAGTNTVKAIEEELFDKGYKGNVVIACFDSATFIESAAVQASGSKYKSQIYFSFLKDYSGADNVIKKNFKNWHGLTLSTPLAQPH